MFLKASAMENKSYLNEGGGKVSFVKIIAWSIVV